MKYPPKSLGFNKALDLLRLPGHRLMLMHNPLSPECKSYYLVPGGYVEPKTAEKIIAAPDVHVLDNGLLDGHPQSWVIGQYDSGTVS